MLDYTESLRGKSAIEIGAGMRALQVMTWGGGIFFASQAREALVPRAVNGEESGPAAADMDV